MNKAINNTLLFNKQNPVPQIDHLKFIRAITDKQVKCLINGATVNNPTKQNVTVDISFRILDDLEMTTPETSITGNILDADDKKINVRDKNVTLRFDAIKSQYKNFIEIDNTYNLYSIISTVLINKGLMESTKDSITINYDKLDYLISGNEVYLTSKEVFTFERNRTLEVTAINGGKQ